MRNKRGWIILFYWLLHNTTIHLLRNFIKHMLHMGNIYCWKIWWRLGTIFEKLQIPINNHHP